MKIYVICPVRKMTNKQAERIRQEVLKLEAEGHEVHWPARDTDQDASEMDVCIQNFEAIFEAEQVAIWWDASSEGSKFDLGMAFAISNALATSHGCGLSVRLLNKEAIEAAKAPYRCFEGLLLAWEKETKQGGQDDGRSSELC